MGNMLGIIIYAYAPVWFVLYLISNDIRHAVCGEKTEIHRGVFWYFIVVIVFAYESYVMRYVPVRCYPVFAALTIVSCAYWGYDIWKKARSTGRKKTKRSRQLLAFYQECVKHNCRDMALEQNKKRARLIAEQMDMTYPHGIEQLLQKAEQENNKDIAEREKAIKEKKRKEEEVEYKKLNRYASYTGREKRIAMVRDTVDENRRIAELLEQTANNLIENSQQREHNAATWGGIANGIAGFGAGITTALQTELENIQIRANNAKRMEELIPVWRQAVGTAARYKSLVVAGEELIKKTQIALVSETKAADVLKKIKHTKNPEVEVSITGAVRVNAYVRLNKKEAIFENVPAVADGTIVARILEGGQEIARVNLVCPLQGIGAEKEVNLQGIALVNADQSKKYKVTFGAENLWLMEE